MRLSLRLNPSLTRSRSSCVVGRWLQARSPLCLQRVYLRQRVSGWVGGGWECGWVWLRVAGCGWVSGVRLGEGLEVGLSSRRVFVGT